MSKKYFRNTCCLLAFFTVLFSARMLAVDETSSVFARFRNLSTTSKPSVEDNKYGMTTTFTSANTYVKSSTGRVTLKAFDTTAYVPGYTQDVWVMIYAYDFDGILSSNSPMLKKLTVTHDPDHGDVSQDMNTIIIEGAHRLEVKLMDLSSPHTGTITSTDLTTIKNRGNLALELEIETERYYKFTPTSTINFGYVKIFNNDPVSSQVEQIEAYWSFVEGAEEYDLEWTYVDDYGTSTATDWLSASALNVHFRNNSTRVTVTGNSYRIPIVYEHGYLVFRVRAVGRDITNTTLPTLEGSWFPSAESGVLSTAYSGSTPSGTSPYYDAQSVYPIGSAYMKNGTNETLNWQYTATFAEGGKRKQVASFADGSLRSRQMITENNSDQTVIVAESIYDFQGRKAVDILPVPEPDGLNTFTYHPLFNKSTLTGNPGYSKDDFDVDNGSNCVSVPKPLATSAGAGKYYSANNDITGAENFQKYTPNAFGYPFVQTEYMPDNTGRIRAQSGVGDNHYLGTGHETQYDYGTPDQKELDAMFGTDVGYYVHYKKNMVKDANGQTSISYVDMHGRTIATALSGGAPGSMTSDDILTAPTPTVTATYINSKTDDDSINGNSVADDALVFTKDVLIDATTDYTISYNVVPENYTLPCPTYTTTVFCFDCIYDLHISLKDKCGKEWLTETITGVDVDKSPAGYTNPVADGYNALIGKVKLNATTGVYEGFDDVLDSDCGDTVALKHVLNTGSGITIPDLPAGSYTLTKTLTVNQQALDYYTNKYLTSSSCITTLSEFETESETLLNAQNDCGVECAECDQAVTLCESGYKAMLVDVSPGGQYAGFATTNGEIDASAYSLSVLNENNSLPHFPAHYDDHNTGADHYYTPDWKHPIFNGEKSFYRYNNGMIAYVPIDISNPDYQAIAVKITLDNNDVLNYNNHFNSSGDEGTGKFIPVSTCTVSTCSTAPYVYGVRPDQLLTATEFKNAWRASFARELVEYHPEFAYYQFCITQAGNSSHYYPAKYLAATNVAITYSVVPYSTANTNTTVAIPNSKLSSAQTDFTGDWVSTASTFQLHTWTTPSPCSSGSTSAVNLTSDAFDDFLRSITSNSKCELNYFLVNANPSTTPCDAITIAGTVPSYSTSTTTDLIDLDPLFRIEDANPGYNAFIKHQLFGAKSKEMLYHFRQMMLDRLYNLGTSPLGSHPNIGIKEALASHNSTDPQLACQNVYYSPNTSSICVSSETYLNDNQVDKYITYYLGIKQEILKAMADEFAKVPEFNATANQTLYNKSSDYNYFTQLTIPTGSTSLKYVPGYSTSTDSRFWYRKIKGYNKCIGESVWTATSVNFVRASNFILPANYTPAGSLIYDFSGTSSFANQVSYAYNDHYNSNNISYYAPGEVFGFFDKAQACNYDHYSLYVTKTKRFQSGNDYQQSITGIASTNPIDYMDQLTAITDQQYYDQTHLCPITNDFKNLLNDIAKGNLASSTDLGTTTQLPLWVSSYFTNRLYDEIGGSNSNFQFFILNPAVTSTTFSVALTYTTTNSGYTSSTTGTSYTVATNLVSLTIPPACTTAVTSFSDIDEVIAMSNVTWNSGTSTSSFSLTVMAGGLSYIIPGTSYLNLTECSSATAPDICKTTPFANDIQTLMNSLITGGSSLLDHINETSGSGVSLNGSGSVYTGVLTSTILSQLGAGSSACTWNWLKSTTGDTYTISASSGGCSKSIQISLGSSLPTSGSGYVSMYFTGIQKNGTAYEIGFEKVTSSGVTTYTVIPITIETIVGTTTTSVSPMDCDPPANPNCVGIEYDNYTDVDAFLTQLGADQMFAKTSLTPLTNYSAFNASLMSQLPGGTTASYYLRPVYYEVTRGLVFDIVYPVSCDFPNAVTISSNCYSIACSIVFKELGPTTYTSTSVSSIDLNTTNLQAGASNEWNATATFYNIEWMDVPVTIQVCFESKICEDCYTGETPGIVRGGGTLGWSTFSGHSLFNASVYNTSTNTGTSTNEFYLPDEAAFLSAGFNNCLGNYLTMNQAIADLAGHVNTAFATAGLPQLPANPMGDPSSNYFVPANQFCSLYSACITDYIAYLDGLNANYTCLAGSNPAACSNYPIKTYYEFETAYCQLSCVNTPHIEPLPAETLNVEDFENECIAAFTGVAQSNALTLYNQYILDQREQFRNAYISKCMAARENFHTTYDNQKYHYTLYYYDQGGNLIKTVPPKGVVLFTVSTDLATVVARRNNKGAAHIPAHAMSTVYTYNSLNQLVSQITPDQDYLQSDFYYDKLGRMVASQNPKQKAASPDLLSYTKYDGLGRITEVGEMDPVGTYSTTINPTSHSVFNDIGFNSLVAAATKKQITKTTYDYATLPMSDFQQDLLRGRVTSTSIDADGNGTAENSSHYSYDVHGNVKSMINSDNYNLAETIGNKRTDYEYDLLSGKVNAVHYQDGIADQFHHKYEYDADNRLVAAYTSTNKQVWDRDAKYFYYLHGPLARTELGQHKVQGMDYYYTIQGWIKGVNSDVLNTKNDPGRDAYKEPETGNVPYQTNEPDMHTQTAVDAYGYTLGYFEQTNQTINGVSTDLRKDYVPLLNGTSTGYLTADPYAGLSSVLTNTTAVATMPNLYNGNIKHTTTTIVYPTLADYFERGMPLLQGYKYDQLNRIRNSSAFYGYDHISSGSLYAMNTSGAGFNVWDPAISNNYATDFSTYTYDANGNIKTLTRKQQDFSVPASYSITAAPVDNYTEYKCINNATGSIQQLTGEDNTNRLDHVAGFNSQTTANYEYDEIGNLTKDVAEGIDIISWNVYGKIEKITKTGVANADDLEFRYDSKGNRIMKIKKPRDGSGVLKSQNDWVYTIYQRDAQGNVLSVYDMVYTNPSTGVYTKTLKLKESDIYGSSRIGLMDRENDQIISGVTFDADIDGNGAFTNIAVHIDSETELENIAARYLPVSTLTHSLGNKQYELTNHLGNVMTVVSDKKKAVDPDTDGDVDYYVADLVSAMDYGAFGNILSGRNFNSSSARYQFNSKEFDPETGTQDYGARIYNPNLGRFLSVDAIANKFPWWSPYAFAGNTPIQALDLDGYEILNYKTPFRIRENSGGAQLTNKWEIARSWSEDFWESQGMVETGAKLSTGLKGASTNPPLPMVYPIYPGTGDDQVYYTLSQGEQQSLDFFGVGSPPGSMSDASSNHTDGMAADKKKGEMYTTTNRNKAAQDKTSGVAGAIEWLCTKVFMNSNVKGSINAKSDLNNIIRAYADATTLVENFYDFSTIGKDMGWNEKQVNQYKADIINFVVDGKLPNNQTKEYNAAIENSAIPVITSSKEADAQKPLNSK
ncbi:MAG: RHS repeat-associated core domain-containing protein [Bacteroidota bacterium]|nr:RHS repeat-associated core domain-containing protein [Bacteroidota bacterium]